LYCIYICFVHLEEIFHIYDGFVFPNLTWWSKINSYFTITGIHTKDSHGYALIIFLQIIDLDISMFDISKTYETVNAVYSHLRQKRYLLFNDAEKFTKFCCTDHLDKGLQQVCV